MSSRDQCSLVRLESSSRSADIGERSAGSVEEDAQHLDDDVYVRATSIRVPYPSLGFGQRVLGTVAIGRRERRERSRDPSKRCRSSLRFLEARVHEGRRRLVGRLDVADRKLRHDLEARRDELEISRALRMCRFASGAEVDDRFGPSPAGDEGGREVAFRIVLETRRISAREQRPRTLEGEKTAVVVR
jgi:hypothetical protein